MHKEVKQTALNRHARRRAMALGGNEAVAHASAAAPVPDAIIREPECHQRTGLSRSTRWRLERVEQFPRRRRISPAVPGGSDPRSTPGLLAGRA
jgi:predicted DNA-binding transcriptional regulator AlpA